MGWLLDSDFHRDHVGAAVGVLADGTTPTYRLGPALYERPYAHGQWEGPRGDRPTEEPVALRAICLCGWIAKYLSPRETDGPDRLAFEEDARARWMWHARAATSSKPPQELLDTTHALGQALISLSVNQPEAALILSDKLRDYAQTVQELAVPTGRMLGVSWEELAACAGFSKQNLWRKFRGAEPIAPPEQEIVAETSGDFYGGKVTEVEAAPVD